MQSINTEDTFNTITKLYKITFNDTHNPHKTSIHNLFLVKRTETEFDEIAQNETEGIMINVCGLCYDHLYHNLPKTKQCFQRAVELGDVNAMNNLGDIFEKENNIIGAKQCYQKAIELGNSTAMNNLGMLLNKENNINEAKMWYQKASELGNSSAMYNLGFTFHFNENNINDAKLWYQKSSELGDADSMNNLGYLFQYKENNINEAKIWYRKASELGNAIAMYNLGYLFEHVENNVVDAKKYYKMCMVCNKNVCNNRHKIDCMFTKLELYNWLSTLQKSSELLATQISFAVALRASAPEMPEHLIPLFNEIRGSVEVTTYKNKIEHSTKYNIVGECNVCLETNQLLIGYNCMHFISCITCYTQLKCCPLCRST